MGRILIAGLLLLLFTACNLNLDNLVPINRESRLPAAAYFQWAATASDEEREQELDRLQAASTGSPVTLVQRAILLYYMGNAGDDPIAELNLSHPDVRPCGQGRRCRDYVTFAGIFSEKRELEARLSRTEQNIRSLQDRIRILDQQIEALTNIEQQLLEREQNAN